MSVLFLANGRISQTCVLCWAVCSIPPVTTEQVRHVLYMPSWMSVLFNGMMSGLSVLFQTELRVQNKTDSEILACLSYSRVSKGPIRVSVLFYTSGPGICLSYSMV